MHYKQLTKDERYQIKACLQINMKQVAIAKLLKRSLATITKEIKHNTGKKGYRSKQASDLATARRLTAKKHIKLTPEIRQDIVKLIKQELSPEQVCDYLEAQGKTKFHHETIYRLLLEDKHVGGTLYKHLRHLHKSHRKRYGSYERRGRIKNVVSIKQRPSVVDSRSRIGDWENDTVISKNKKSAIYTLVDRKILYTIIVKLNSKNATELAGKTLKVLEPMPSKIHTVTYDNGLEFAEHERMAKALGTDIYFAHSYSSWERGINENINGLIRQYFPKGTDFNKIKNSQIEFVMNRLNTRPQKTRGEKQPIELFLGEAVDLLTA